MALIWAEPQSWSVIRNSRMMRNARGYPACLSNSFKSAASPLDIACGSNLIFSDLPPAYKHPTDWLKTVGKEVWPHPSHLLKRVNATTQAQLAWSLKCSQSAQSSALRKQAPLGVSTVPFALREKLDTRLRLGETGKDVYGLVERDNRPGTSQAWSKSVCTKNMPGRDMKL